MSNRLLSIAGDLDLERKKIQKTLTALERPLLENPAYQGVIALMEECLDRINSISRELVSEGARLSLSDCAPFLGAFASYCEKTAATHGKTIRVEIKGAGLRMDTELLKRFDPVLREISDKLIGYGIESAAEREARKKKSEAYFRIEMKTLEDGYRLMIVCDGNGVLPPSVERQGERLAELGIRGLFEGKPGHWGAWVFHLPVTVGAFRCVRVRQGERFFFIPYSAAHVLGEKPSKIVGEVFTLNSDFSRARYTDSKATVFVEILSGTDSAMYAFDAVDGVEEVHLKALDSAFDPESRFLGACAITDGLERKECLSLVLNPAFLVYEGTCARA